MAAFERWNRLVEEVTKGQQGNNNRDTHTASQNAPNSAKRKKDGKFSMQDKKAENELRNVQSVLAERRTPHE